MLMKAHCITIQVIRAILFKDSPCCGEAHRGGWMYCALNASVIKSVGRDSDRRSSSVPASIFSFALVQTPRGWISLLPCGHPWGRAGRASPGTQTQHTTLVVLYEPVC